MKKKRPSFHLATKIETEILPQIASEGRLPTERELASRFGVGRSVVREALLLLELRELVSKQRGSGTIKLHGSASLGQMGSILYSEIEIGPFELIQARQICECAITKLAAKTATATNLRAIQRAVDKHVEVLAEPHDEHWHQRVIEADKRFHLAIGEATHNLALLAIMKFINSYVGSSIQWKTFQKVYRKDSSLLDTALYDHKLILECLLRRDAKGAEEAMRAHIFAKRAVLKRGLDEIGETLDDNLFDERT